MIYLAESCPSLYTLTRLAFPYTTRRLLISVSLHFPMENKAEAATLLVYTPRLAAMLNYGLWQHHTNHPSALDTPCTLTPPLRQPHTHLHLSNSNHMTTPHDLLPPRLAALVWGMDLMGITTTLNPLEARMLVGGHVLMSPPTEWHNTRTRRHHHQYRHT